MSDTTTVTTEIRDFQILVRACQRGNFEAPREDEEVKFYDGTVQRGMVVHLPRWQQPCVFHDGQAFYDNFEGRWGDLRLLHDLQRDYATENTLAHCERLGVTPCIETLENGKLVIEWDIPAHILTTATLQ